MSSARLKRKYRQANAELATKGFRVALDGVAATTPLGQAVILPNQKLADAIAQEYEQQGDMLDTNNMPLTRIACIALDVAAHKRLEIIEDLLAYGETDLLYYRAEEYELQHMQEQQWNPLLEWMHTHHGVWLRHAQGVMPIEQPRESMEILRAVVEKFNDFQLAALATAVKASGSLVLSLALLLGKITGEEAIKLAQLDERYQMQKWGEDESLKNALEAAAKDLHGASHFMVFLQ